MNLIDKIENEWTSHSIKNNGISSIELVSGCTIKTLKGYKNRQASIFITLDESGFSAVCKSPSGKSLIEISDEPNYDEFDNEIPCCLSNTELFNKFIEEFNCNFILSSINYINLKTSQMIQY